MHSLWSEIAPPSRGLPEPPQPRFQVRLAPFLCPLTDLTDSGRRQLTALQKQNVAQFQNVLQASRMSVEGAKYAIVDASRRPRLPGGPKRFGTKLSIDHCPTLSTNNKALYILPVGIDDAFVPTGGRFIDVKERAAFSGVTWQSVQGACSNAQHLINFGNIIPVDLAGFALAGIMSKWALFEKRILDDGLRGLATHFPLNPKRAAEDGAGGTSMAKRHRMFGAP